MVNRIYPRHLEPRLRTALRDTSVVMLTGALGELRKQADWAERAVEIHYFRTAGGQEVDFVLEHRDGRVAGVEVKAARTLSGNEFAGLRTLAAAIGDKFVCGVVLYLGDRALQFADRLWAMPVNALWRMQ